MVHKLIEKGLQQHRAGHLEIAKSFYEQALAKQPRNPDALNLLGVVALQSGQAARAAELIEKAIQRRPDNPAFHANLAQAYLAQQRYADAQAAYRRASRLQPREPQFAIGAANALAMQGHLADAEREFREVLRQHPGSALGWFNLANTVRELGRAAEAAELYQRAIEHDPGLADAYSGLGGTLHAMGRLDEAERAYRQSLAREPGSAAGHRNLASVLVDRGAFAEAVEVCRRALAQSPDFVGLHLVLGAALLHQGRLTAALEAYRKAAAIAPDEPRALWGHGYALVETGDSKNGLPCLEAVRQRLPDAAEYRDAISLVYLSLGDWQAGWTAYAARGARMRFLEGNPGVRLSDVLPDDLTGKTVCVLREQGLGDELFFLRFAAALKARGARILYQAHPKIAPILARVPVLDGLIPANEPPPAAEATVLVGDLPRALRVFHPEPSLPLTVLPGQLTAMRQKLAELGPPPYRGVTWRAGTPPSEQRGRDWALHKAIGLDALGAALRGAGGTWIALQRNPAAGEIEKLASIAGVQIHDFCALNEELEAMLALLALLDDYVGVSNTNMHLRAGTGRTARVIVPCPSEWRWMAAGNESPWFPGFRIYRQRSDGDWNDAVVMLGGDLREAGSA